MTQPLEGLIVLDWTIWQQGPVCSAMLGDMGARVIKIEQRGSGDPGRYLLGAGGADTSDKPNWYFEANNRNKESITVDLKKPEGVEVILALAEKADVFVQNFRKGVSDRLGLGYAALRERRPKCWAASSPWGRRPRSPPSPWSGWPTTSPPSNFTGST